MKTIKFSFWWVTYWVSYGLQQGSKHAMRFFAGINHAAENGVARNRS